MATTNSGSRAMPAARLGAIAREIFGPERVTVARHLPDAIETAVALAEEDVDAGISGVGVLITGSVVTVADARRLLPGGRRPLCGPARSAGGCGGPLAGRGGRESVGQPVVAAGRHWVSASPWPSGSRNAAAHSS